MRWLELWYSVVKDACVPETHWSCIFRRALWLPKSGGLGRESAAAITGRQASGVLDQGKGGRNGEDGQRSVLFVGNSLFLVSSSVPK